MIYALARRDRRIIPNKSATISDERNVTKCKQKSNFANIAGRMSRIFFRAYVDGDKSSREISVRAHKTDCYK